jgi:hypothetical protein
MNGYGNPLTEYSPQMETFEYSQGEEEFSGETGGVFNESQEMAMAAELLEISNEEELDHFLGDLIKKAGSAVGKFVSSPVGKAIGGVLKSAAKTALPIAGGALGAYFGGPIGAQLGSNLAGMAGSALGLELEGLSQEDREFESARQFVRWAGETAKNTLAAPQSGDPTALARAAAAEAARIHAPGLLNAPARQGRSGQWVRRGNRIIIHGI